MNMDKKASESTNKVVIATKTEPKQIVDYDKPPVLEPQENTLPGSQHQSSCSIVLDGDGQFLLSDDYYIENRVVHQKCSAHTANGQQQQSLKHSKNHKQQQTIEGSPNFESNVCCGLCGSIISYGALIHEHLPTFHPEVLAEGVVDLEEIPYEAWLSEQQQQEATANNNNIPTSSTMSTRPTNIEARRPREVISMRQMRRISQYRVNTAEMSIPELELALQKKMVEKMGRKVPVTLMDKLHAKCGICDTVISLNKKFEIVHLVRHFNAWHPSSHKCAGEWPKKEPGGGKPLSAHDFAVFDTDPDAVENLQCIWCGMFLSNKALGMHFHEIHPEEVEVPKCNLCMQELLINARLQERFREDFGVTLPDERTFRSIRFKRDFKTEKSLEKAIVKYLERIDEGCDPELMDIEDLDASDVEDEEDLAMGEGGDLLPSCEAFANSKMVCGRRAKPKRKFVMPVVRQAAPVNSNFVSAITHSHWRCLLCGADIFAAVISAGVIKHYKRCHQEQLPAVQLELCKARLDKVSDGNMVIYGNELECNRGTCTIECQLCSQAFPMTPPFNICRALRHIKVKHPEVMPEHNGGESTRDGFSPQKSIERDDPAIAESHAHETNVMEEDESLIYVNEVIDTSTIETLRSNYGINFNKAFSIFGKDIEQEIFILTAKDDVLDNSAVEEVVRIRDPAQNPMVVVLNKSDNSAAEQRA